MQVILRIFSNNRTDCTGTIHFYKKILLTLFLPSVLYYELLLFSSMTYREWPLPFPEPREKESLESLLREWLFRIDPMGSRTHLVYLADERLRPDFPREDQWIELWSVMDEDTGLMLSQANTEGIIFYRRDYLWWWALPQTWAEDSTICQEYAIRWDQLLQGQPKTGKVLRNSRIIPTLSEMTSMWITHIAFDKDVCLRHQALIKWTNQYLQNMMNAIKNSPD